MFTRHRLAQVFPARVIRAAESGFRCVHCPPATDDSFPPSKRFRHVRHHSRRTAEKRASTREQETATNLTRLGGKAWLAWEDDLLLKRKNSQWVLRAAENTKAASYPQYGLVFELGGQMRHEQWDLEPELREVSEWVDWMERELMPAGIDMPGISTCFKFSASSLRLAHRIARTYRHLPNALRSRLIEGAVLHQCWRRSLELSKKGRVFTSERSLAVLEGQDLLGPAEGGHKLVLASDGHEYAVRFPTVTRQLALATEVISFEIAKAFGLPTAPLALVAVDDRLAACAGFPVFRPECPAGRRGMSQRLPCLGVRRIISIGTDAGDRPRRPLSAKARGLLVGEAVLEILTTDMGFREPCFTAPKGFAEPVFNDYSYSFCGADWTRFLEEEAAPASVRSWACRWVHSYQQLEHWIAKAECLDADRICEVAIKLPPSWYGTKPLMMVSVIQKLHQRSLNLRSTVVHLIDAGYFPKLRPGLEMVGTPSALSPENDRRSQLR